MAFHAVTLPNAFANGYQGGPSWATIIHETEQGQETRIQTRSQPRRRLRPAFQLTDVNTIASLINFANGRRGSVYSFRVRDILDFSTAADHVSAPTELDQTILTTAGLTADGTAVLFQLSKVYDPSGPSPLRYKIRHPDVNSTLIAKNGTLFASGGGANWTVNVDTGVVTFTTPPANGTVITAGCNYSIRGRFSQAIDSLFAPTVVAFRAHNVEQFEIVEELDVGEWPDIMPGTGFADLTLTGDYAITPSQSRAYRIDPGALALKIYLPPPDNLPGGVVFDMIQCKAGAAGSITFKTDSGAAVAGPYTASQWTQISVFNDGTNAYWVACP